MQRAWWLRLEGLLDSLSEVLEIFIKDLQSYRMWLCVLRSSSITIIVRIVCFQYERSWSII